MKNVRQNIKMSSSMALKKKEKLKCSKSDTELL